MEKLCSLNLQASISSMSRDLHKAINNHPKLFRLMLKDLSPNQYHDHVIHLSLAIVPKINEEGKIILEVETIIETRIK